jgi:Flp pilus assembly protein TadD
LRHLGKTRGIGPGAAARHVEGRGTSPESRASRIAVERLAGLAGLDPGAARHLHREPLDARRRAPRRAVPLRRTVGKGQPDRAIADFDQAIRLNPNFADAFYNRGNAYGRKGQPDRAIADFDQAIRLNPNYSEAFKDRGNAYDDKGQFDRALQDYDQAIRLNPNLALAFYDRGLAYFSKGQYDRAIADYDQAIRLDPKYAAAFINRGAASSAVQTTKKVDARPFCPGRDLHGDLHGRCQHQHRRCVGVRHGFWLPVFSRAHVRLVSHARWCGYADTQPDLGRESESSAACSLRTPKPTSDFGQAFKT